MRVASLPFELDRRVVGALVVGSLAVILARLVPPPWELPAPPPPEPTYTLVPLLGESLSQAVDDADGTVNDWGPPPARIATSCLPFLAPLVEHPNWQLQIVSASSGCLGETIHDRFVIASDGRVAWQRHNMPARELQLTADELARIRTLDRKDCIRRQEINYGEAFYRIALAGLEDAEGGAHVSHHSTMAEELDAILDAAKDRYRAGRIAELGITELRLHAPRRFRERPIYRLDVVGHRLTVRHGRRVLLDKVLETDELVESLDRLQSPGADVPGVRGWLRSRGVTRAVALPTITYGDFFDPLLSAIDEAAYAEDPTR